ncbi:hypothetical protein [Salipiger sp.]|uniref:hypothetical protein n=1 Tax=Salipiger sp. TaxID=2078585 RepID=UPI003A97B703
MNMIPATAEAEGRRRDDGRPIGFAGAHVMADLDAQAGVRPGDRLPLDITMDLTARFAAQGGEALSRGNAHEHRRLLLHRLRG